MSTVSAVAKEVGLTVYEQKSIAYTEFTDGGSTAGTLTCGFTLPVGFFIEYIILSDITGFAGDTSAALTVGDGSDADRLNASTLNVFSTLGGLYGGVPSGTRVVATAFKPVITITSAADFTSVNAGALTLKVYGHQV